MNIRAYIHPVSTFMPCTGIGRHTNNIIKGLHEKSGVNVELLVARQWLNGTGQLNQKSPLGHLTTHCFPFPERWLEHSWKLMGFPFMDKWMKGADWGYCPAQTFLPTKKIPTAITIHDIEAFEKELPWSNTKAHKKFKAKWSFWIGKALKKSNLIFTVSEFTKRRMVDLLNANPKKIKVIGNGIAPRFFNNNITSNAIFDFPYSLIIGGLRQRKGALPVLEVAKALKKRKSSIRIISVGQNENRYIQQAKHLDNLIVLGMKSDDTVHQLLQHASSLLFLSYYEGFGIPALEAMATGVPVIASNKSSLPEIIGDAGFTFPIDATNDIADQIIQLENNNYDRMQMIQKGKKRAAHFTWEHCVNRVLQSFKEY